MPLPGGGLVASELAWRRASEALARLDAERDVVTAAAAAAVVVVVVAVAVVVVVVVVDVTAAGLLRSEERRRLKRSASADEAACLSAPLGTGAARLRAARDCFGRGMVGSGFEQRGAGGLRSIKKVESGALTELVQATG